MAGQPHAVCRLSCGASATSAGPAKIILHPKRDDCADAGKGIAHQPEQVAVAQTDEFASVDRVQQLAHLVAESTGVLPRVTTCLGPRTEPAGMETRIRLVTR